MVQIKYRTRLFSFIISLLSFIFPGIGQLMAGKLARALFFLGMILTLTLCGALGGKNDVIGTYILYAATLFLILYISYDAYKMNANKCGIPLQWYNKWYFYTLFVMGLFVFEGMESLLAVNYAHYQIANESNSPVLKPGDNVIARMNYGHQTRGLYSIKIRTLPFLPPEITPVLIFSDAEYSVGSYIVFSFPNANGDYIRKIVAMAGETFKDKSKMINVPSHHVLISLDKDNYELIPIENIKGKILYVFFSPHLSRIGKLV